MKKHKIDYNRDFTHQDENVKEAILNEVSAQATYLTMLMIRKFPALKANVAKSVMDGPGRAAPEPEWPGPTRPRPRPSLARSGGPGQKFLRPDRASGGPGYRVEKFGRAGMRQLARPDPPGPARVWPDINVA